MSALLAGRLLLFAFRWRRGLIIAGIAVVFIPALLAAGVLSIVAPAGPIPLVDPLPLRVVTQPFGCTTLTLEPVSRQCATGHFHSGIDLAAPWHTPVLAAHAGIASAGFNPAGYGLYVIVERDALGQLATVYAHLSVALVSAGDTVRSGQPIGLVGSSGNSTGPHLHFEVRVHGVPVDPAPYLPPARQGGGG
ncbi:MAG TPA: M23 family metallopeptidase [Candidatus Limnocylindrales bacterium]|nr:M23 family metallopeptidase [Candidatus Limnocylindrales bacterium]